ncbi:hypothetical protein V6N13_083658 [Hibiscus sabdariffa]
MIHLLHRFVYGYFIAVSFLSLFSGNFIARLMRHQSPSHMHFIAFFYGSLSSLEILNRRRYIQSKKGTQNTLNASLGLSIPPTVLRVNLPNGRGVFEGRDKTPANTSDETKKKWKKEICDATAKTVKKKESKKPSS